MSFTFRFFAMLSVLGWLADTLWVFDLRQNRLALISPARTLARTVVAPTSARPIPTDSARIPPFPMIIPMATYPDGSFYAGLFISSTQVVPAGFKSGVAYGRITADRIVQKIVAVASESGSNHSVRGGGSTASLPFVSSSAQAISQDGSRSAIAIPVDAGADSAEVRVTTFDAEGDTIFSRQYQVEGIPIPRAVGDSVIEARASELQQRSPELAAAVRREARVPKFYPPIEGLLIGRDGTVWVQLPNRNDARAYLVIDANGGALGTLQFPRTARLAAAQRDRIWLLERDENDVQSIVRYRADW
ncbi:MAG: hypothetical protein WEE89_14845 [Gemmatimonadota bacterium]